jgi:hypothetical protein
MPSRRSTPAVASAERRTSAAGNERAETPAMRVSSASVASKES